MQLSLQEKRRSPAADGERAVKGEKKTVTEPRGGEVKAVSILAARRTFPKNPNYRKVL